MTESSPDIQQKLISRVVERLAEIESELLRQGIIQDRKPAPTVNVEFFPAKAYVAKIEIDQSKDGMSVHRAVIVISSKYVKEVAEQKHFPELMRILIAHLACTIYFPHDPGPDTFYWRKVMDVFGYFRAPKRIPGFPRIICQRRREREI
jgi:hypothetical protein